MKKYLEAKNTLMEYTCKKARVASLYSELAVLSTLGDSINGNSDQLGKTALKEMNEMFDFYDKKLVNAARDYVLSGDKTLNLLAAIKNPEVQTVLLGRYISQMTLEGIAIDMKCSLSKVKHLHREGLKQVQELLDSDHEV